MNKKLTVNRLAFGSLRARKKQYALMIIGIVLAMIFSSGVMFFLFCMNASTQEFNDKKMGKQDITINNAQKYEELINAESLEEKGYAYVIGYGFSEDNKEEMGSVITRLDEKAREISYILAKEGRMPEKKGEIAIESDALSRLGLYNAKIGDEITLKVKVCDGENYLAKTIEKTYTLVGRLWDKRSNIEYAYGGTSFYPSAVVSNEEEIELGGKENVICFITLKNSSWDLESFIKYAEELYPDFLNTDAENVLMTTSNRWNLSGEHDIKLVMLLMIVLSAVLMVASCFGIVNAFNTNLQARHRQIGMLRAVGATKRQIIKIFGREAFIIALFTTPISLVASYYSVKMIISAMGNDFVFIAEWWVLAMCGVFGIVCVMAAAFIPLFFAARVSPIQAIRNIELTRKMNNKKIRSQKSFNEPKLIAKRNLLFFRKKRVAVSLILVFTIFVFCFGISLVKYELNSSMPVPGDYHIQNHNGSFSHSLFNVRKYNYGYNENDRNEIISHHYVANVNGRKAVSTNILMQEYSEYMNILDYVSSGRFIYAEDRNVKPFESLYDKIETKLYKNLRSQLGFSEQLYQTKLNGFEEDEILKYLKGSVYKGEVNIDKLNSGEEIIIIAPERIGLSVVKASSGGYYNRIVDMDRFEKGEYKANREISRDGISAEASCEYKVGDTIKISTLILSDYPESDINMPEDAQRVDREVRIAAIVTQPIKEAYFRGELSLYTTVQGFNKLVPEWNYWSFDINLNEECNGEIDEEMTAFITSFNAGSENSYFHSYFKSNEEIKSASAGLFIAIFSISILFFSICASIINNTLTAQIREGKREIGTLRAVGASARELTASYFRQLLSMFGWGCGLGFGIYSAFWLIMYWYSKTYDDIVLSYEIWQAALVCVVLFAICSLNLHSKIKKQIKNSIVDNIREL